MKSLPLPKSCFLLKPWEYQRVYRTGKRLKGRHFSLIYVSNDAEQSRLGISVHGVKRAVRRNRIKRIIREFYRHNREFMSSPADVVFAVRKGFEPDSFQEVERQVKKVLERLTITS